MEQRDLIAQLEQLSTEYAEFRDTSRVYEAELEEELASVARTNQELLSRNAALEAEVLNLKQSLQGKVIQLQRENAQSVAQIAQHSSTHATLLRTLKELETEVETNRTRLREKEHELAETTERYNQALEELTLTDFELESVRTHAQEHMRRLQEHIAELSEELDRIRCVSSFYKRRPLCVNNQALSMVDALMHNIQGRMKRIH